MKVHGIQRTDSINQYNRNNEPRTSVGKKEKKKDEVVISNEAKELLHAQNALSADERARKIQDLKHAVSTGTYHVEARKIAEKLFPYLK